MNDLLNGIMGAFNQGNMPINRDTSMPFSPSRREFIREDGTQKGPGWMQFANNKGQDITEYAIGTDLGLIPSVVPGMSDSMVQNVINASQGGERLSRETIGNAVGHAKKQMAAGEPVFAPGVYRPKGRMNE